MPLTDAQKEELLGVLTVPNKPYFGEGVQTFEPDQLTLWFCDGAGDAHRVSLARNGMTEPELAKLLEACQPATFGRDTQDVFDESYRKAGKIDRKDFALNIDLVSSNLLDKIHDALFGWEAQTRGDIRAELYKLNVYGPGSFFKAHKDTPRGDDMFGSLVLNFPIVHEGGALMLRHNDREASHDPSKTSYTADNQVSWVAFFSDVEHEVLPVTSGHRVTITYNLFHQERAPSGTLVSRDTEPLLDALQRQLADPKFLPEGGRIGIALSHQYPVPSSEERKEKYKDEERMISFKDNGPHDIPQTGFLGRLQTLLKGSDQALFFAAESLGLSPRLALFYTTKDDSTYLWYKLWAPSRDQIETYDINDEFEYREAGAEIVQKGQYAYDVGNATKLLSRAEKVERNGGPVYFVVQKTNGTKFATDFVAYGNEASLGTIYADVVLVIRVPPSDKR